jgi:hypothetical protein
LLNCNIMISNDTITGIKIITINWNIAISCIYEWMKCCQKRKIINEWFILLREIILLGKSQLECSVRFFTETDKWTFPIKHCTPNFINAMSWFIACEGEAVPASYKIPAVLLICTVKSGKSRGSDRGKKTQ